ncbi:MAG: hypothetical protein AB7N76_21265 [Planctomycetota bacterium]
MSEAAPSEPPEGGVAPEPAAAGEGPTQADAVSGPDASGPDASARPIRIYGLDPAGDWGPGRRRGCGIAIAALFLATTGARAIQWWVWPALQPLLGRLPWYRPELAALGVVLALAVAAAAGWRLRRWQQARRIRAELHPEHLVVEQAGRRVELTPRELRGFRAPARDAVELEAASGTRTFVPTPNEVVRALVLDWLAARAVPRLDE